MGEEGREKDGEDKKKKLKGGEGEGEGREGGRRQKAKGREVKLK